MQTNRLIKQAAIERFGDIDNIVISGSIVTVHTRDRIRTLRADIRGYKVEFAVISEVYIHPDFSAACRKAI